MARRGSATGQFYLGMAYQHGLAIGGLAVDPQPKKAMRLYRAAAAQHHHEAEYNLAVMLLESNPESEEAHMLLQTAAKEGVKEAQEVLAWESCKKEECEDPSEQPRDLFGENGDDILGSVEDGGEQLYQWGRQWEREAAKTRGDEWVQVGNVINLNSMEPSVGQTTVLKRSVLYSSLITRRCPCLRKLLQWAISVPQQGDFVCLLFHF